MLRKLLCLLLAALPLLAQAQAIRPDRVILLDAAVNSGHVFAVGERGTILESGDVAGQWRTQYSGTNRTLTGIAFEDPLRAVIVGHGGTTLYTVDGGQHWLTAKFPELGSDSVLGVLPLGGDDFLLWGAFGLLARSSDGGASWTKEVGFGDGFDRHISQIIRTAPGQLLLVGESGTLALSDDDGRHWRMLKSPYQGSLFGALATKDGSWLIYGMRGNLFRSADAGQSWSRIDLGTTLGLMNARQLPGGRVLLVGNAGLVARSDDNGFTFHIGKSPRGLGIAQIAVTPRGDVVAVGEGGIESLTP
jgi:photosystem II stability/assembly factor-like uncharacterized protein